MSSTYKVLGQIAPNATSDTPVYTVPGATQAVVSTIIVANHASTPGTFRVAVRPDGSATEQKHYLAFDTPIQANDSIPLTFGITLDSADVISAYCSSASMSVNVFGTEIV
jgi:hypothetical protein